MISPEQWERFFKNMADLGNIRLACEASGIHRSTVHAYNRGEFPEGFDGDAWTARFEAAREDAADRLEAEAFRRAHDGWAKKVYKKPGDDSGGVVEEWAYSDALMVLLLKANRPEKFKDRAATELTGKDGGPIQTENKVIAIPAIPEDAEE